MAEVITLDPSEVAAGRTEVVLSAAGASIQVASDGPDWGTAEVQAYMAQTRTGEVPVDYRRANRQVTIPLQLGKAGDFGAARETLQNKVGLIQREGGWLKREVDTVPLFLDVVNASLKMSGHHMQAWSGVDPNVDLVLDTLPDWYGEEVEIALTGGDTGAGEYIATVSGVEGDFPARCRVAVQEAGTQTRQRLVGGFRARSYSADATAGLVYEAEGRTLSSGTTSVAVAGASGGNVAQRTVSNTWTDVLTTQATGGGAHLTHTGSYRVFARVRSTESTEWLYVRLAYDVGDLANPTTNPLVTANTQASTFMVVDLGEVRLRRSPIGTHRWQGKIQAMASAAGAYNIQVDKFWLVPTDESMWHLLTTTSGDAVLYANRFAELRHNGCWRSDSAGVSYGPAMLIGDLPRLPPSGAEARTVQLILKGSRGGSASDDEKQWSDTGLDALSVELFYRPTWLFVPGT